MIGGLGAQELLLIFLAVLILFGAKRIPDIAQGLGKGIREFKKEIHEVGGELDDGGMKEEDDPAQREKPEGETRPGEKPGDGGEA